MGRSAEPLAGLDSAELLRAWEAASAVPPLRRAAELLDAVLPDLPVAAELLPLGSCDTLLLALRAGTFGTALAGVTTCPACDTEIEIAVDVGAVLAGLPAVESAVAEPDPLQYGDYVVRFRLPTTADLAACADHPDAARLILDRCIVADGHADVPVDELPAEVREAVADALAAADRAADLRLRAVCPECGSSTAVRLDVGAYFWDELTIAANTLLAEIDELASRYGWSEAAILAMTPTRRRTYLELR